MSYVLKDNAYIYLCLMVLVNEQLKNIKNNIQIFVKCFYLVTAAEL